MYRYIHVLCMCMMCGVVVTCSVSVVCRHSVVVGMEHVTHTAFTMSPLINVLV